MPNAFIRKLSRFGEFDEEQRTELRRVSARAKLRLRGEDLVLQGQQPAYVQLLLSGWAYRYKVLRDGRRQIIAYLLPGDVCDLHGTLLTEMDHSIGLLTDARVASVSVEEMRELLGRHRPIERALWRASLADEAILREWLVNVGQRDAFSRTGHHLCELWHRVKKIGLVHASGEFDLPLTQEELGDALGLTSIHVSRTIKRLREEGLIALKQKRLTLLDPERLGNITGFDGGYIR